MAEKTGSPNSYPVSHSSRPTILSHDAKGGKVTKSEEGNKESQMPFFSEEIGSSKGTVLRDEVARLMNAYWRAANYLCLGMLYLRDNPLLREPLRPEHIKQRLLGHWGSDPGQTFIWVHLNRLIKEFDLDMIYISGPRHGAPAVLANAYLEGTYSEVYPDKSESEDGLRRFFKQFSVVSGSS